MLDGRKIDDACVRFTAKDEKERMRDKILGVVMMFIASLKHFLHKIIRWQSAV